MGKFVAKETPRVSAGNGEQTKPPPSEEAATESAFGSDIPPDIIFPDQLNRYFREQVHSLTLENGGLRRSLEETQEELAAMKQKMSRASQPTPAGRVAETADFRIAQLSKRLREQNAEMESLRTQTREAEAKLRKLQEKTAAEEEATATPAPSELAEKDRQIKALTEKLQAANAKMCDFRNQHQAVKQELKLAQRVIESEVGERCSFQELAKENGTWRGRAQQILALQNKVQALQEQLNSAPPTAGAETPAASLLRQMEKDRRAGYEETSKQLNQKTIQVEELRKKLEAARARNKVLEGEILHMKTKLTAIAEKGARDEQLLSTLTNQINAFEDRGKAQMQCFSRMEENMKKLHQELELERTKGEQLQRALSDREARIHRMEQQIGELRKNLRDKAQLGEEDEEDARRVTAEKATETSGGSPGDRLNASGVAETERLRLLELVGVMNRRLEESRRDQNEAEGQLRRERYKNAKLETKIARLELEKVGAMKTGRGSYSQGINKVGDSATTDEADILARQHIEYLEEECLALKTRIETLQMEREADLNVLASLVGENEAGDPELRRRNLTGSPSENSAAGRGADRKANLNRRKVRRSPANTIRSGSLRQSSFSSEEFRLFDKNSDYRLVHQ